MHTDYLLLGLDDAELGWNFVSGAVCVVYAICIFRFLIALMDNTKLKVKFEPIRAAVLSETNLAVELRTAESACGHHRRAESIAGQAQLAASVGVSVSRRQCKQSELPTH